MPSRGRSIGQTRLIRDFNFTVDPGDTEDFVYAQIDNLRSTQLMVEVRDTVDGRDKTFNVIHHQCG